MPSTIRADTDQMRAVARQMRAGAAQIVDQSEQMCVAMDMLDTSWSGSARERGMAYWAQLWPRHRPAAERLLGFAEQLDALAARLDEAARVFGDGLPAGGGGSSGFGGEPTSMGDLAALVAELYGIEGADSQPIKFVQIGPNDYLIMLAGTETGEGGNNWGASSQGGFGLPSAFEREVQALIAQHIPPGAKISFAAHSLGGIVANNLADNQDLRDRYQVANVITFGSPESAQEQSGTNYFPYAAQGDVVPMLMGAGLAALMRRDIGGAFQLARSYMQQTRLETNASGPGAAHSSYPDSAQLAQTALPFQIQQWQPVGQFSATRRDSMSLVMDDLTSGNALKVFMGLHDVAPELVKLEVLGQIKSVVDIFTAPLEPTLRNPIDRYMDRYYSMALALPTPTQALHPIVDGADAFWRSLLMGEAQAQ